MSEVVAHNYNRKTVHVLYMDIVKSSSLDVEDLSDVTDAMREVADQVLEETIPGWRNAGIVAQPSGDGLGLVFQEDPLHPAQVALGFLNRWPDWYNHVRIGINTGPVDVRDDLITGLKTCQGSGIVDAQRVMALNSEGRILMTQEYVNQISRLPNWSNLLSPIGWRALKDHRIFVYELLQADLAPLPADAGAVPSDVDDEMVTIYVGDQVDAEDVVALFLSINQAFGAIGAQPLDVRDGGTGKFKTRVTA